MHHQSEPEQLFLQMSRRDIRHSITVTAYNPRQPNSSNNSQHLLTVCSPIKIERYLRPLNVLAAFWALLCPECICGRTLLGELTVLVPQTSAGGRVPAISLWPQFLASWSKWTHVSESVSTWLQTKFCCLKIHLD